MFLVSNKQLVFTACSSHPFAMHKLPAGHFRTTNATRHRKTPVFLCGGCKSCLKSFVKYFWHPIYIIQPHITVKLLNQLLPSTNVIPIQSIRATTVRYWQNKPQSTAHAMKYFTIWQPFLKATPLKISNLIYKSFSVIVFKTDIE